MDAIAKRPCDPRMTIERCELLYDRVIVLGAAHKSNASPNVPISSQLILDLFVPRSVERACLDRRMARNQSSSSGVYLYSNTMEICKQDFSYGKIIHRVDESLQRISPRVTRDES